MPKPEDKPFAIPKQLVWEAYRRVAANKGAPGVDGQALDEFEADLADNLYRIWNRMSSGSYFPPPVRAVEIPKPHGGGVRVLGVPTLRHTARSSNESLGSLVVTHPFHPLSGERLEVLYVRRFRPVACMCAMAAGAGMLRLRRRRPIAGLSRRSGRCRSRCWSRWWRWSPRWAALRGVSSDERLVVVDAVEWVGRASVAGDRSVARADGGAGRAVCGLLRGCGRELPAAAAGADVGRGRWLPSDWVAADAPWRCRAGASAVSGAGLAVLSANHIQADDWLPRSQRVERAAAACAPASAGGRIGGSRADVARGVVEPGPAVLERGVPLPARRVAWPVLVSRRSTSRAAAAPSTCPRRWSRVVEPSMSRSRSATRRCWRRSRRSISSC